MSYFVGISCLLIANSRVGSNGILTSYAVHDMYLNGIYNVIKIIYCYLAESRKNGTLTFYVCS